MKLSRVTQYELVTLQKNGYISYLDGQQIDLSTHYLNQTNIASIKKDVVRKTLKISRKDKNSSFISFKELLKQRNYPSKIDFFSINSLLIDSSKIYNKKFETGSIKYIRLLTQKDYSGKEYDDLPQVKQQVGNGILMIITDLNLTQ